MDALILRKINPTPRFCAIRSEIPVVATKHQKADPIAMPKDAIQTILRFPLIPIEAAKKVLGPGNQTARQKIPHADRKFNHILNKN